MQYKFLLLSLLCIGIVCSADAKSKKKQSEKKSAKTETSAPKKKSPYDKLLGEKHPQAQGLINLHRVKDKLYFELPVDLLGKRMILGSTVTEISDPGDATVGSQPQEPLLIYFTQIDSTVQMRQEYNVSVSENPNIAKAIEKSNIGAIREVFKIEAWNADSTAVVFDVTKVFVGDYKDLSPLDPYGANTYGGYFTRSARFQSDKSFLGEFKAFEDNVMIRSHLSYECDIRAGNGYLEYKKPVTAQVTRTLILLPEEPMEPRKADPRLGIFPSYRLKFGGDENRAKYIYFANRWKLEPQDPEAFNRGELVEPVTPIVFYMDSAFPEFWAKNLTEGVLRWNSAFEKIGFKNAVQVKPFPTKEEDPEFDPDNIKYSCIRYSPVWTANAMGPSWTDPRTGQILNASVYVYHNLVKLLYNWRFVHTAAADASVRSDKLPDDVMADALKYVAAHEVGHCLGFMHNMGASSTIPVDSLRSPSFTRKYGTTYSIMDYARNNYVAQPGDVERGVSLTPPEIGIYDDFLIKWSYSPLPGKSQAERDKIVTEWADNAAKDRRFRYGKQQIYVRLDPSAQSEDLGDDAMKASNYGISNLKLIMANMNKWFDDKGQDRDFTLRASLYNEVIQQYVRYLNHVYTNIGGAYLTERYAGDPTPTYEFVPKEKQKRAVQFLMDQAKDLAWLDNKELMKNFQLIGSPQMDLQAEIVDRIMGCAAKLGLAEVKAANTYTAQECMNDIYQYVWASTLKGKNPSVLDRRLQQQFVKSLISKNSSSGSSNMIMIGITDFDGIDAPSYIKEKSIQDYGVGARELYSEFNDFGNKRPMLRHPEEVSGFGYLVAVNYDSAPSTEYLYYGLLQKSISLLRTKQHVASPEARNHYQLLLLQLEKAMQK